MRIRVIGCSFFSWFLVLLCNLITKTMEVRSKTQNKRQTITSLWKGAFPSWNEAVNLRDRNAFRSLWSEQLTVQFSMTRTPFLILSSGSKESLLEKTIARLSLLSWLNMTQLPEKVSSSRYHPSLVTFVLDAPFPSLSSLGRGNRFIERTFVVAQFTLGILIEKEEVSNKESSLIQSQSTFSLRSLVFLVSHDNSLAFPFPSSILESESQESFVSRSDSNGKLVSSVDVVFWSSSFLFSDREKRF